MQEDLPNPPVDAPAAGLGQDDVHNKLGLLTRQLHDALRELGYADRLRSSADKLPDAQNRLSYIARLTGEAAEKVLSLVDDAKVRQTNIVNATKQMRQSMIADPVAAVAKGHIMNYLEDMETATEIVDQQLTDIMMAQDFHDLTGQVIAKVVTLASSLESQLVELLVQTAPAGAVLPAAPAQPPAPPVPEAVDAEDVWAAALAEGQPIAHPELNGPVVDPASTPNVVSSQSEVDDLLASLGF
ncbi:protein phosphatase CheZ [Comamonas denitrificans]|jgi:chemotaxis protein CheZ|uniref:Protein phosphatase CheZ n=1 Tax=Comamonas denitrificans TaxID=117506 RepID=A0A939H1S6_9BURK|nr:protein phosphatase CheZ [Comamonas denitrificans]MBO1250360.1 protein phosphatase CheZ [Comamonas denitrificans]